MGGLSGGLTRTIGCTWVLFLAAQSAAFGFAHQRYPVAIPMRDGQSLAADVYLPQSTGAWPVVLIQTPYNKNGFAVVFLSHEAVDPLLKSPAYAFVVLDWRGFYGSAGAAYAGSPTGGQDGFDAVEWIAAQPWCSGAVGTWGASALGNIQMRTAAEQPPHLRACVPITYHYRDFYELSYPGGVYARNRNEFVYALFGGLALVKAHPTDDVFWRVRESGVDLARIDVPMLHITGWYDHETDVTIREMLDIQVGGGPAARGAQKLLIGPWSHGNVGLAPQGQLSYPAAAYESSLEALAFFDFYLRGIANGLPDRPSVRYFVMNAEAWKTHTTWPPPTTTVRFFLRAEGLLSPAEPSSGFSYREYPVDPTQPVPTLFGAVVTEDAASRGPGDLRPLETRDDVLTFTTAPRAAPLMIEGRIKVTVWLSCESPAAVDTDIMVRLADVYPDGRSMLLVDGARRASLRNGFTTRQFLSPGAIVPLEILLPSVAVSLPQGHALRVLLAPSNYDLFDVNLQDGSALSDEPSAAAVPALCRLWCDRDRASMIELPVPAGSLPPADLDLDGDVDLEDFMPFSTCYNGPNRPAAAFCAADADFDNDSDVDLADFEVFQTCFGGPNSPPACHAQTMSVAPGGEGLFTR